MDIEVVILAAGKGTRMRSRRPKVMHTLAGRTLLAHVLEAAVKLGPRAIHVVVGHQAQQIINSFPSAEVNWIVQDEQLGTGHAV